MIQDIAPSVFDNHYMPCVCGAEDYVLVFDGEGRLCVRTDHSGPFFPLGRETAREGAVYLFSIDSRRFFLAPLDTPCPEEGFQRVTIRDVRDMTGGWELFAAFTAYHLWRWYAFSRYCGRCGAPMALHNAERALVCQGCGQVIYPRINPAVIVGVIRGDCLLITRYRTGYAHNALVAGFSEIGETLEGTVAREVMEETGIRVKNIRYWKSQPWGMAQDLLAGFFCDADGDGEIRMDQNELKYAQWVRRDEIVPQPNSHSLTNDMMRAFMNGEKV